MEEFIAVLALLAFGVLIGVPIAAFVALSSAGRARKEVEILSRRLAGIEQRLSELLAQAKTDSTSTTVTIATSSDGKTPRTHVATPPSEPTTVVETAPIRPTESVTMPAAQPRESNDQGPSLPADSPILTMARRRGYATLSEQKPDGVPAPSDNDAPLSSPTPGLKSDSPQISPGMAPRKDVEESLGGKWAVWIGGVTLALGGLFLVKYSIDQGIFGPSVRIASGLAFAIFLVGLGEWFRRAEAKQDFAGLPSAHIPSIFTAAGAVTAFGVVWAAYALYGMVSQNTAFLAMGFVGLGTLLLAQLHVPALAALGLLGSFTTPILVGGDSAHVFGLVVYLGIVAAIALLIAALRGADWLAWATIIGHGLWGVILIVTIIPSLATDPPRDMDWRVLHALIGLVCSLGTLIWLRSWRGDKFPSLHPLTLFAMAAPLALLAGLAFFLVDYAPVLRGSAIAIALLALTAIRFKAGAAGAAFAALLAIVTIGAWPAQGQPGIVALFDPIASLRLDFPLVVDSRLPIFAAFMAGLIAFPGIAVLALRRWSAERADLARCIIAFSAAIAPVAILTAAVIRMNGLSQHRGAALLALGLCLLCVGIGEWLYRSEKESRADPHGAYDLAGSGAFLAAAATALGLAIALALPRLWLAVGLAVASAGTAFVLTQRPVPALATLSALLATAAIGRAIFAPLLDDVGTWPIFNWLLAAYGLPALAFIAGATWLRNREPAPLRHLHEALAIIFMAMLAATEIRQFFVGPNLGLGHPFSFGEVSLGVAAALLLAVIAAEWARVQVSPLLTSATSLCIAIAILAMVVGLLIVHNPLISGRDVVGVPPFNILSWAYGIPALAAAFTAWRFRGLGAARESSFAALAAGLLATALLLLQIRRAFQGQNIHWLEGVTLAESGFYSGAAFAGSAILYRLAKRRQSNVLAVGASAAAIAGMGIWIALIALGTNPLLAGGKLAGRLIFDNALIGFGLPALAAGFVAWSTTESGAIERRVSGLVAILSLLIYCMIETRRAFVGPDVLIMEGVSSDAEWYAYSVLFVVFGLALLVLGFLFRNRDLRLASAGIMLVATLKVFLFDMAGLEGIMRALSFIGLGLALMGIGLFYQRLLANQRQTKDPARGTERAAASGS